MSTKEMAGPAEGMKAVAAGVIASLIEKGPWMTITTGGFASKEAVLEALKAKGIYASEWATRIVEHEAWQLSTKPETFDLYKVEIPILTGENQVSVEEIYALAQASGCCDAPDDAAIYLD